MVDARPREHAGDLRKAAGLAVFQPETGHRAPVPQPVEGLVVELRHRLEVQNHDRCLHPLHHGEHGRRQRIGGDEEEQDVHLFRPERGCGIHCAPGVVDKPGVHHPRAQCLEPVADGGLVPREFVAQTGELVPVGVESDTEQSDRQRSAVE